MAPLTFLNINDGKRDRLGAFGEWEAAWNPQWVSLLGVRFEQVKSDTGNVQGYNTAAVYASGYLTAATNFNAKDRKRTDNNWDATALGRYTPDTTSSYEFGFAHKTRSPNLYERYSWSSNGMALEMNNFVGDGNGYLGNLDLKPEVANTLSATGNWHGADSASEFKVTPFYTRVSDYIDAVRRPDAVSMMGVSDFNSTVTNKFVKLQYANQSARLYGVDISGRVPLAKTELGVFGFKGLLNYTNGKNLDTGDGLYNIMPLNTKLSLTHEHGAWSNVLEVVGVRTKTDVSAARNEIKTPGYGLVHVRASYSWKQARFDAGIENLFDKFYYLPTGGAYTAQGMTMSYNGIPWGIAVPGMGRSLYAGVTVKF
jgi:iron complex outermembrane receptor protein